MREMELQLIRMFALFFFFALIFKKAYHTGCLKTTWIMGHQQKKGQYLAIQSNSNPSAGPPKMLVHIFQTPKKFTL